MSIELPEKKFCLLLSVYQPVNTTKNLLAFFELRGIAVQSISMQLKTETEATVTIHFLLSRDRSNYIYGLIKKMELVVSAEMLESKVSYKL